MFDFRGEGLKLWGFGIEFVSLGTFRFRFYGLGLDFEDSGLELMEWSLMVNFRIRVWWFRVRF